MRVAAVQFKPDKADLRGSLARLAALTDRAAAGCDLVVLPEMCATGYVFASAEAIAPVVEAPSGPTFQALAPIARAHGAWIVAGFPERDGDRLFNSAHVIDPAGERRFVYRKTCLYEADLTWAEPGDSGYATFDTDAGDFTVGICMDLNDDAFVDWCRERATRAIAFPTNWIDQGQGIWGYWAWRLGGVPSALVAANTYGVDEGTRFCGTSAVLLHRTILAAAPAVGDGFIVAEI